MFYERFVSPLLAKLPAEFVSNSSKLLIRSPFFSNQPIINFDLPLLKTELFGETLDHPISFAAGLDKNVQCLAGLFKLGAAMVEVGSVTPLPQFGNPKPRMFKLQQDHAMINRMGFNNHGSERVAMRIEKWREASGATMHHRVGISIASNNKSKDPLADFLFLTERFAPLAGYIALDISCPNSENGKVFLQPKPLKQLLNEVNSVIDKVSATSRRVPLVAKISIDLSDQELADILTVFKVARIDGLIISNSTINRPASLTSKHKLQIGGLTGTPLFAPSTQRLGEVYKELRRSHHRLPLIGVGGISNGAQALAKIKAGAEALQLYTAISYRGPFVIMKVAAELADCLKQEGFSSVSEAVGVGN